MARYECVCVCARDAYESLGRNDVMASDNNTCVPHIPSLSKGKIRFWRYFSLHLSTEHFAFSSFFSFRCPNFVEASLHSNCTSTRPMWKIVRARHMLSSLSCEHCER